jgi:recombination protein RecR
MIDKLVPLDQLLKLLQRVPYLASRNVYRVASHFLSMDTQQIEHFCAMLLSAKNCLTQCSVCFCWQEKDKSCVFCIASERMQHVVCVVETWQELMSIEKTKGYDGVYHVLGGVISPLEGIGPDDLSIKALIQRVATHGVQEVILATNQTPEGEATATYIAHKLKGSGVKVTCLARGLPVGSSLEAVDRVTVYKALAERRLF